MSDLTNDDWKVFKNLCEMLKTFEVATRDISSENFRKLSNVYPVIHGLVNKHLVINQGEPASIIKAKQIISKPRKRRFYISHEPEIILVAGALNLAIKTKAFIEA